MPPRRPRPAAGARSGSPRTSREPASPRIDEPLLEEVELDPDVTPDVADARITGVVGDDLEDVELTRCTLDGLRLTAVSLRRARLVDVVLRDCELSGADLHEAQLTRVRIERCRAEALDGGMLRATDV